MEKQLHQKQLSNLELSEFFNQISMLTKSGISIPEALNLLLLDAKNNAERELLSLMLKEAEVSGLLYPAADMSGVFPDYALHMIRLGEETGNLDSVLEGLSDHYIREENLRGMIRSALIYPCIMLGMMLLVVLVLLTKVMPIFQQVFWQLGHKMSGLSAGLLQIGETLSRYSAGIILFTVVLIVLLTVFRSRLPFSRRMQKSISASRFAGGMSIALKSGLTPEQGLELAYELVESSDFRNKIASCQQQLASGTELSQALTNSGILTGSYARTAYIAGRAGRMDEAMAHISEEYAHAADTMLSRFLSMLEPTLVILLSIVVGVILFSVMFPLLGILSGL